MRAWFIPIGVILGLDKVYIGIMETNIETTIMGYVGFVA